MMQLQTNRIARLAVFTALAMILSWMESQIPAFFPFPGMKLGLTNLVVVFSLYDSGPADAFSVNLIRIFLSGILFGNPYSIAYSMAGGVLSFVFMILTRRSGLFSVYGVSMAGGVFHNVGQILVAAAVVQNYRITFYLPVLLVTGCATGFLIGFLSDEVLRRIGQKAF